MESSALITLIHTSPFYELTALVVLAAVFGFVGMLLRQPMIVSFIAVGILAGPSVLDIVHSEEIISLLAELGIALLLFLVGLKLDLHLIRTLGVVSLATGLGQVFFTAVIGFFIGVALGLDTLTSLYVAVALTFSSTIIIVKLLSDKKEVDSLHGRIAIGFLIVQDLFVVLSMMVLSTFGIGAQEANGGALAHIASVLLYGLIMLVFVYLFIRYVADMLVERLAHSPELLITFTIGWAALLAALGSYLGFSKELGGLLAGVSLASTAYREIIVSRMAALRDFLLLFFFIALGMHLDLSLLGTQITPAIVFSLFILIGNPLIVMAIMGYMGYQKRTGFLAGLTVAQISEFSLIFMAMGLSLGHVSSESLGLVTLVGLITIAMSVYMITYSHRLYSVMEPILWIFERHSPFREVLNDHSINQSRSYDIILFGAGRYGSALAWALKAAGKHLLIVDFNPEEVKHRQKLGFDAIYGDAGDQEFIATLPLAGSECVILAMSQPTSYFSKEDQRFVLIDTLKESGYQGKIAVTVQQYDVDDQEIQKRLIEHGADMVFLPYRDAARDAVEQLEKQISKRKIS
ncbi:cation:proton antiporter [Sulfurovum sp.]|uniref:cation:proton antiporter n=1 Tax=Sulfurovum sp. TaxID=1969726 RepID=UPI002A35F764|nr:cation:proton antiporter [Sulfurovum sp.]MDD2452240.1 cation:proton antiporter [Sulfurovum sp.]MDY0402123.1 cation:proton antiporter [Sulfurovum sp.]